MEAQVRAVRLAHLGPPRPLAVHRLVKRYWVCRGCGHRNELAHRKCRGVSCSRSKPKKRAPAHAAAIRGDNYQTVYVPFAAEVHGVTDESCCLCGKPKPERARHHRDHGHLKGSLSFGKPRGILCFRCNALLPREVTADWLEKAHAYLERVDVHYSLLRQEGVEGELGQTG